MYVCSSVCCLLWNMMNHVLGSLPNQRPSYLTFHSTQLLKNIYFHPWYLHKKLTNYAHLNLYCIKGTAYEVQTQEVKFVISWVCEQMVCECHLLSPLLIEQLDAVGQGQDGLLEAAGPDDVLQVLQHALVMLRLTFGLHHGYLLHLTLNTVQITRKNILSFQHGAKQAF